MGNDPGGVGTLCRSYNSLSLICLMSHHTTTHAADMPQSPNQVIFASNKPATDVALLLFQFTIFLSFEKELELLRPANSYL